MRLAAAAIGLTVVLAGARPAGADELTLSVAISLKDVIEELGRRFAHARPGVALHYFGASGDLQKQIEAGAPVDVFLSAATSQMDQLERRGLVLAASRRAVQRGETADAIVLVGLLTLLSCTVLVVAGRLGARAA